MNTTGGFEEISGVRPHPETEEDSASKGGLEDLLEEVAVQLSLTPVLAAQLDAVVGRIEGAVSEVCSGFSEMIAKVQASLAEKSGEGDGEDMTLDAVLSRTQETLAELVKLMLRSSEESRESLERLSRVQEGVSHTLRLAQEVERFINQVKLLSMNARIEAARMGDEGKAFAIIAAEITDLARQGTIMGEQIQTTVQEANDECVSAYEELKGIVAANVKHAQASETQVAAEIEGLKVCLEESARRNDDLTADITKAIVALQFQDEISQRVGHVTGALREMQPAVAAKMRELGYDMEELQARSGSLDEKMNQIYTMESERRVQAAIRGGEVDVQVDDDDDDNVELF